jgi:hypothetical protein
MRVFLKAAITAITLAGAGLASSAASAQVYYDQYGRPVYRQPQVYNPYRYQQPTYVPPRIARKQAQQRERFIEKYGYQYQQPRVYRQPRVYQQPQPYVQRGYPRPQVYHGQRGIFGQQPGSSPYSNSHGGQAW